MSGHWSETVVLGKISQPAIWGMAIGLPLIVVCRAWGTECPRSRNWVGPGVGAPVLLATPTQVNVERGETGWESSPPR